MLDAVTLTPEMISPNADGSNDLARIEFMLNKNAKVGITFVDENGKVFIFRQPTRLSTSEKPYSVLFSGVVDPFTLPGDDFADTEIIKRVLPDGYYTWIIKAETDDGHTAAIQGGLTIRDSDTALPLIKGLTIYPKTFSPNQDGIADRTTINFTLSKNVEQLNLYLQGPDGIQHYISENEVRTELTKGWYTFDYDGGIDAGSIPPSNGTYTVFATARDLVGQSTIASSTISIINAGLPRAYIVNSDVQYSSSSIVLSDTLCFTLTVENDSDTYIRTTGPWPGTTYQSEENYNAQGYAQESGVFRIGMDFDTSLRNYPYRWGIGQPGVDLVTIDDYWYLPPRARSEITGCVHINEVPVRNPLYYWMGLIHEDVEIAAVNNNVDPYFVTIWEP
ncbi:MAG: hypothetical protein P1S60_08070 [Anaerolineae bacterium]|nr:hypothetical protein [Anaerolineae bacterium]